MAYSLFCSIQVSSNLTFILSSVFWIQSTLIIWLLLKVLYNFPILGLLSELKKKDHLY